MEGYCGEPLVLERCRVPISAPVTLGAGARGLPNRLGFGHWAEIAAGCPGNALDTGSGDAGTSADETRGALGGGGCGRTPCEEPQPPPPPPGMIDDDDDDKMGSLLAFGLAPCKKICVKQHWDDVSHARVSPASLLVVGDCKLTAYRSAMGKPPLLPMAAGRDCVQIDRPPDSALWFAGQVAQRSDRSWRGT